MRWGRVGQVHASAPYVIEPASENYGVVRYRLTGPGGLDELSRSVHRLKEMAEAHQRRLVAEAQEQRQRKAEQQKQLTAMERHLAEVRDRAEGVLTKPAESHPDWTGLTQAEIEDRIRQEATELFAQRQQQARQAADDTPQRQREIIARAEAALADTE
jgi:hypothetical protein